MKVPVSEKEETKEDSVAKEEATVDATPIQPQQKTKQVREDSATPQEGAVSIASIDFNRY